MRCTLAALAALTVAHTAHAQEAHFPRAVLIEESIHQTVPPVRAFLDTLRKLWVDGEFDTGKGVTPRDDLGGLSAKRWLMDHIDPGFECRRDFGGMCTMDDVRVRFSLVFLADTAWGEVGPDGPDPNSPDGLAALAFNFQNVLSNTAIANGEGESCVPAIAGTSPDLDAVMIGMLGENANEMLEAYDNFVAVRGRYRIRAAPSVSAPVVGGIADEVVFLPGPGQTFTVYENERSLEWSYVVPSDGPPGFAALEAGDIVALSGVASPQICVAMRGGRVVITAHAGAGD